ncbi:MAG: energy transducer TonB, partial [Methylobacter sp.]|nr:energy transducer TonB [Methylobacter sp.]
MYFFKNHKDGLTVQALTSLGGVALPSLQKTHPLFKGLTGEENPRAMGGLLLTLVLSAHLCAAVWMLQPAEPVTQAKPMIMEVSLVAA